MVDVVLEVFRTAILIVLVIYLWKAGRDRAELSRKGWRLILAGAFVLLLGSALDITDNFESLSRFYVIGDTEAQAFLEKIVGSVVGSFLLTLGLLRWIPTVTGVEITRNLAEELAKKNRELHERADELETYICDRDRMKDSLDQSEQQYRAIFESTTECLLVIDLEGIVVEANPAACRTYGYTRDEMVGLTGEDFVHPDHYSKFLEFKLQLQTSDHFYAESVDVRKDGSAFDIEVRGTTFQYRGKPHLLAVIQDVTRRKRAEEDLRE
ncbi:MAG TPA: PAS domain S-box protein, partial [Thermoguttaceae bacterium]|nr:PAS domain S-box protein [Thermoguttaceae bacterium]